MATADVLALVAAALFAVAAALQQREAMTVPGAGGHMSAAFFLQLARRPIWLLGTACLLAGYFLQGVALGDGRVIVIQPILVTTIVFALPLGVLLSHQVVARRDWLAAAGVVVGLALFIVVGDPASGRDDAPGWEWAVALVVVCVLAAAGVFMARRAGGGRRAALLGGAAGMLFGISACLAKPVVEQIDADGLGAALENWLLYGMVGTGAVAFFVQQGALATGQLSAAVASASLLNPVVASVVGALVLEETLEGGAGRKSVAVAALAAAGYCAALLAVREQPGQPEPPAPGGAGTVAEAPS